MQYLMCLKEGTVTTDWLASLPIQYLVDLRKGAENLPYETGDLPIFHSYDLLDDAELVDTVFYETTIPTLHAAYPPPKRAQLPKTITPFQVEEGHVLFLTDVHIPEIVDAYAWDGRYWVGEQPQEGYEKVSLGQLAKKMNKQQGNGLFQKFFSKHKEK